MVSALLSFLTLLFLLWNRSLPRRIQDLKCISKRSSIMLLSYTPPILNDAEGSTRTVSDSRESGHLEELYRMCPETRVESSAKAHGHVGLTVGNQQEALVLQNGRRE